MANCIKTNVNAYTYLPPSLLNPPLSDLSLSLPPLSLPLLRIPSLPSLTTSLPSSLSLVCAHVHASYHGYREIKHCDAQHSSHIEKIREQSYQYTTCIINTDNVLLAYCLYY